MKIKIELSNEELVKIIKEGLEARGFRNIKDVKIDVDVYEDWPQFGKQTIISATAMVEHDQYKEG